MNEQTLTIRKFVPDVVHPNQRFIIKGAGFRSGCKVSVSGVPAALVDVRDEWTIAVTAPLHAMGTCTVVVEDPISGRSYTRYGLKYEWPNPVEVKIAPTDLDTFVGMLFRAGHKYTIETRGMCSLVYVGRPIVAKEVPGQEVFFVFVDGKLSGP